jgi:hypothetical protein
VIGWLIYYGVRALLVLVAFAVVLLVFGVITTLAER